MLLLNCFKFKKILKINNKVEPMDDRSIPLPQREKFLEKFTANERLRILKNVTVLGLAFMIHFTAFHGTANLQSSVNADPSIGPFTLAAIYGSLIVSNIFLSVVVITWLGCKWTIAVSFLAYIPFIAAQFFPAFYTLIPAGLAVGFGGGPLWCAKCTYLTVVAEVYSAISRGKIKKDVLVVRFFGLFFVFYQMAQVWGNLISSTILSAVTGGEEIGPIITLANFTNLNNVGEICGKNFCPGVSKEENPNLIPPEPSKIQILSTIYLCCIVTAILLVIFALDSLKRYETGRAGSGAGLSGIRLLAVTVKQLSHKYQLLLLPITMFIGAEQAFITAEFTSAFVSCGWGISKVGFAMICFGVANAIAAGLAGAVAKLIGRIPVMIGVMVLHSCIFIFMREWVPVENDYMTYCGIAAFWGLADGIWLVQVNALSGILFPGKEEAAYSNFRLWESTGSVITYASAPYFCTSLKLVGVMSLMIIGMLCYGAIEVLDKKERRGVERKNFELVGTTKPLEN